LLLVYASIKSVNNARCLDSKCFTDSKKSSYCNWPASFDLLPVARGKSMADHVFLRVAMRLAEFFDPNSESTKELAFINHRTYLEDK